MGDLTQLEPPPGAELQTRVRHRRSERILAPRVAHAPLRCRPRLRNRQLGQVRDGSCVHDQHGSLRSCNSSRPTERVAWPRRDLRQHALNTDYIASDSYATTAAASAVTTTDPSPMRYGIEKDGAGWERQAIRIAQLATGSGTTATAR